MYITLYLYTYLHVYRERYEGLPTSWRCGGCTVGRLRFFQVVTSHGPAVGEQEWCQIWFTRALVRSTARSPANHCCGGLCGSSALDPKWQIQHLRFERAGVLHGFCNSLPQIFRRGSKMTHSTALIDQSWWCPPGGAFLPVSSVVICGSSKMLVKWYLVGSAQNQFDAPQGLALTIRLYSLYLQTYIYI